MRADSWRHVAFGVAALAIGVVIAAGCDQARQPVVEQELPEIRPNLPPIPKVPPPRFKIQYQDGTYSVYGLRKRIRQTIEEEVRIQGIVAKIFEPDPCPEGTTCALPPMPHLWLGDEAEETSPFKLIRLVGYAQSQHEMDDAREEAEKLAKRNKTPEPPPPGLPPLVWDWQLGKRYEIKGRFTRTSGTGFAEPEGLLEYMEHRCLDCPTEEEE